MATRSRTARRALLCAAALLGCAVLVLLGLDRAPEPHTPAGTPDPVGADRETAAAEDPAREAPAAARLPEGAAPPDTRTDTSAPTERRPLREASTRRSVHGTFQDAEGRGLADFEVHLLSRSRRVLARARTDEAGAFRFPRFAGARALEARPRSGWRVAQPERALTSAQRQGRAAVRFEARAIRAAVVRGRLEDAASARPLPEYALRVEDEEGLSEPLVTSADGTFVTSREFARGVLTLHAEDCPEVARAAALRVEVEHEPGVPLLVPLAAGPTYHLFLDLPQDVTAAHLRATLCLPDGRVPQHIGGGALHAAPVRARADGTLWVRFRAAPDLFGEGAVLSVGTTDGTWSGSREVDAAPGAHVDVALHLRGSGGVAVAVQDEEGEVGHARVRLLDDRGEPVDLTRFRAGRYRYLGLAPGAYSVLVDSVYHEETERTVRVHAGEVHEVDVLLEREPVAGDLSGIVRSRSGTWWDATAEIAVRSTTDPRRRLPGFIEWRMEGGERVGRFHLRDLPADEYELELFSLSRLRHEPRRLRAEPPATGLEFVVQDLVAAADLGFRVRDARTGEAVERFRVRFHDTDGSPLGREHSAATDRVVVFQQPLDEEVRWTVTCDGYRPAAGTLADFVDEDARGRRFAEVALHPGYTLTVQVRTVPAPPAGAAGGPPPPVPVAGLDVFADGAHVGRTDAHGRLQAALDFEPASVEVRLGDGVTVRAREDAGGDWRAAVPVD